MSGKIIEASTAQYELEIAIESPRGRVWKALIDDTNVWWLPDFHVVGEGSIVTLQAEAGGGLVERVPGGGSLLWYTVVAVTPESSLSLVGHTLPAWGGPTTSMLQLDLEELRDQTVLRVTDALIGRVSDRLLGNLREGWTQLFTDGLKTHAEAAPTA